MTSRSANPPSPPAPSFIFRGHEAPIHTLEFFSNNMFLATGDESGWVFLWDLWKRRPLYKWQAHSAGVLAIKVVPIPQKETVGTATVCPSFVVSHGRDNEIHVWDLNSILESCIGQGKSHVPSARLGPSTASESRAQTAPTPVFSLPVNALNFCKLAILVANLGSPLLDPVTATTVTPAVAAVNTGHPEDSPTTKPLAKSYQHFYIAVPSPTTASLVDIYDIVKPERAMAAIGPSSSCYSQQDFSEKKWGSVMAIQLFWSLPEEGEEEKPVEPLQLDLLLPDLAGSGGGEGGEGGRGGSTTGAHTSHPLGLDRHSPSKPILQMLVAYEDGSVTLFREGGLPKMAGGGAGARLSKREMEVLWSVKRHREPVLALDISRDRRFGISCGSDNILVKYQLENRDTQGTPEIDTISLKANGIADVRIRDDSKIVALAGWDGRIRVFSSKTLKPLAVLSYHREGLYCLGFANVSTKAVSRSSDAKGSIGNALGAGSQEGMVSGEEASVKKMKNDGEKSSSSKSEDDDDDNSDDSDDSDDGEALEERCQWSRRHWIAAAGKEKRISLWEIY